jgi:molecular chaperone GrpE
VVVKSKKDKEEIDSEFQGNGTGEEIEFAVEPAEFSDGSPSEASENAQAQEIAELKKQNLYLMADFDNFRKQAIKERSDIVKYGNEPIIREFLGVLDNLERAALTPLSAESIETYKNGVELIVTQFKKSLERFGVEEVDPQGQEFDPSLHEALGSDSNPDFPPNTVTQVLKKAYKLKGKIIRPAQVLVNTNTAAN